MRNYVLKHSASRQLPRVFTDEDNALDRSNKKALLSSVRYENARCLPSSRHCARYMLMMVW